MEREVKLSLELSPAGIFFGNVKHIFNHAEVVLGSLLFYTQIFADQMP